MSQTIAIVQARMTSSRLPGKVLRSVLNRPFLEYFWERCSRADLLDEVVMATTVNYDDEPIVAFCKEHDIRCYRGSELDVLGRYYEAAKAFDAKTIVRLTADCPLIDPDVIDQVVEAYQDEPQNSFVTNSPGQPALRTFPHGMDVEVFSFETLEKAYLNAKSAEEREHVTIYMRRHPSEFPNLIVDSSYNLSDYRLTLDTVEDYAFLTKVLSAIYPSNPDFTLADVIALVDRHPEWREINRDVEQRVVL